MSCSDAFLYSTTWGAMRRLDKMFVSFEGIDGSGKTSILRALAEDERRKGHDVCVTREPGGSFLGASVREIVLSAKTRNLDATAELFLFLADRAQHVAGVIRPALARGIPVFCDRYTDSTRAYQGGGRGLDSRVIESLIQVATGGLEPDVTILLDLDVPQALARARARNRANESEEKEGRFDAYAGAFFEEVRSRYLAVAKAFPQRIAVVDASRPFSEVLAAVRARIGQTQERMRADWSAAGRKGAYTKEDDG